MDSRSNISASANGVLIVSVNKNRTINNQNSVGVILSLSSQKASASAKSSGSNSTLKVGSRGSKVKDLQKNLTKLGYSTKGIDGVFGKDTKNAVLAFQKACGLETDGIVGSKTQDAIKKH